MPDSKIIHIPMHEILALVEHTITQLSEDDAIEFVMDLQEKISEMLLHAGFDLASLNFSDVEPFWTFSVKKL